MASSGGAKSRREKKVLEKGIKVCSFWASQARTIRHTLRKDTAKAWNPRKRESLLECQWSGHTV